MASAPKTQGYHLAASTGSAKRAGRTPLIGNSKQFLNWTGRGPAKPVSQVMAETRDRVLRTRPLAALTTQVANARHSRDMQTLGGNAAVYIRNPDNGTKSANKIVLAPGATVPQGVGRPGTRPRNSGPQLDAWKSHAVEYNGALSRQQAFNPNNHVLAGIKPLRVSTRGMAEIPVTRLAVPRGGIGNTITPPPGKNHPTTQIV